MVKLWRCSICGDPYIGGSPPDKCPFCGDTSVGSRLWRSDLHDSIYFSCCDRVLVCDDLGLFEETEELDD